MFIRFFSGDIDEDSRVPAGLFTAAEELRWCDDVPDYELDALEEVTSWFDAHLESPFDHLSYEPRHDRAVCWFKASAREHLAKAWELVAILERNDVLIWTIRFERIGLVYYEDDTQVFAQPCREVKRRL